MDHKPGFTIVELVVAASVFAVVMAIAVNLFIAVLRGPLQQIDEYHLYEEITYVFEQVAYHSHQAKIDYASYSDTTNPVSDLFLIANDGTNTTYHLFLDAGQLFLYTKEPDGTETVVPFTSDPNLSTTDVFIDTLRFYIYPAVEPYDPANETNDQEAIVMQVVGHSVDDPTTTFQMQTLITMRTYER